MRAISCATVFLLMSVSWAHHHEDHHHHSGPHHGGFHPEEKDHHHGGPHAVDDHHHHHGPEEAAHSHGEAICHKLSAPNTDFAFQLYRNLASKNNGKNVFFSPVSITMALSMLSMGAKGNTQKQIFSTLNYDALTQDQVNAASEHQLHMLSHPNDQMQLDIGNALYLREDAKMVAKYLEDAKHFYASEGFTVDFKDTATAVAKINQYIASKTNDKITDLVKDLDADSAAVLINYIFFKGKWEKPFEVEATRKAVFHVDEKTKVKVDMMRNDGDYDYHYDEVLHTTVLMLQYQGNASMMLLLPDKGYMKELENRLDKDLIKRWRDRMYWNTVSLSMPKVTISATSSLSDSLKEMGMVDAFGTTADFSGLSETPMMVSKVQHKAVLSIDEAGTEAAASTTIEIVPMSYPDRMTLNRPFLLLIEESSTKSILFMGKINDPTAM